MNKLHIVKCTTSNYLWIGAGGKDNFWLTSVALKLFIKGNS